MATVFAISIFIAFLDAKAIKNTSTSLESGFYLLTAYVLRSAIITGLLTITSKNHTII